MRAMTEPAGGSLVTDVQDGSRVRTVWANLDLAVLVPARIVVQVAAARGPTEFEESFDAGVDGQPCEVTEVATPYGGRAHVLYAETGTVSIRYRARVGQLDTDPAVSDSDRIVFARPSRYAESDRLGPLALAELPTVATADPAEVVDAVAAYVRRRLRYTWGVSRVTDGAVDTLLTGAGVCRDFTHLTIALMRALGVPARATAVYAPGLMPMDFHAVTEVAIGGVWRAVDTTGLAPRQSMVRIVSGLDAAENAFLDVPYGHVQISSQQIGATVEPTLPFDDTLALVSLR